MKKSYHIVNKMHHIGSVALRLTERQKDSEKRECVGNFSQVKEVCVFLDLVLGSSCLTLINVLIVSEPSVVQAVLESPGCLRRDTAVGEGL